MLRRTSETCTGRAHAGLLGVLVVHASSCIYVVRALIDYPQLLIAGGQDVVKHLTVLPPLLLRLCILHKHLLQLLLHGDKLRLQVLPVQGRGHGKRVGQTTASARDRSRDRGREGTSAGIEQGNCRRSRRLSVLWKSTEGYGLRPMAIGAVKPPASFVAFAPRERPWCR
jgi:hypothetical protein